ncbi:unnamed protein product [Parascedosporium putredinis]|uniref:Palmitoyltransferase n=1 Tax=Parascedosporium putredinis TaxID=1442378 RepID=A0A9P1MEW3_9PEZI|nr:unnamed protein product [Parascedosporium putredinis]CAI8003740.1 unnamed protein product [Parascedosporium putredinis]
MASFQTIILTILGISFVVFVIFFGRIPALRNTPIAGLNRLILVHIPNATLALDNRLTGGRLSTSLLRFGSFMMNDRHPTVLIFYIVLLVGSEYIFLPSAWQYMSTFHRVAGSIAILLPYIFLYLAAFTDPGYITHSNHAYHMQLYPYDYSIFLPGHDCRTCRFLKPARSKHCNICKKCVGRMDHHCIFINNLLRRSYGRIHHGRANQQKYPYWSIWPAKDLDWHQYFMGWGYGIQQTLGIGAITLLTGMLAPMVWSLLAYTLFLVYCGTTTNETLKWSDWKVDMSDGYAFSRHMSPNRQKLTTIEPAFTRWPVDTKQVLTSCENGQAPPQDAPLPGEGPWERAWSLRDFTNLYDLGFADNLRDIFFLDYDFRRGRLPGTQRRRRKQKAPKASPL